MQQIVDIDESKAQGEYGFNASKMVESDEPLDEKPKKKRGPDRPAQQQYGLVPANTYTEIVTEDANSAKKRKSSFEGQMEKRYAPQVAMVAGIIAQSDQMMGEISEELRKFSEKPSYGGKSRNLAISNLQNAKTGLLNTKLAAVRDLINMRNKINDLTMQDRKMQLAAGSDDQNSDKAVMDAYYALVNASRYGLPPITQPLHPSSINTGVNLQGAQIATSTIASQTPIVTADGTTMQQAQAYTPQPLTPIQQRMVLEKNPNVKTVVVYNQNTGSKRFDIVDVSTGMSIPDAQRPAAFLLDDMKPDFRNGIASNSNANMSFPLVIEGTRAVDEL